MRKSPEHWCLDSNFSCLHQNIVSRNDPPTLSAGMRVSPSMGLKNFHQGVYHQCSVTLSDSHAGNKKPEFESGLAQIQIQPGFGPNLGRFGANLLICCLVACILELEP